MRSRPDNAIAPNQIGAEINRLHTLAISHATQAVDCAKKAGELLLQVKENLPHGEFLPWLDSNVNVSKRQAQRYMRAAQGMPITPQIIAGDPPKCDTVSHLPESWLPKDGAACLEFSEASFMFVQESADAPGFFYVAFVNGDIQFTIKPIVRRFVERTISEFLPCELTLGRAVPELPWAYVDVDRYFVRDMIEPHLPAGYEHLRRHPNVKTPAGRRAQGEAVSKGIDRTNPSAQGASISQRRAESIRLQAIGQSGVAI